MRHSEQSIEAYVKDISRFPLLSEEEEYKIVKRVENGDERAKHELIKGNLRFNFLIASQYFNIDGSFSNQDLINEGNTGLIRAVDKFDSSRGYRFTTYAVWWIRQAITRYISNNKEVVRLPINKLNTLNKLENLVNEESQKLARKPDMEELLTKLNLNDEEVKYLLKLREDYGFVNIDCPFEKIEIPATKEVYDPTKVIRKEDIRVGMRKAIEDKLNEREATVIRQRYGLDGYSKTLEEVGEIFSITRERVRQIEKLALEKLRRSGYARLLLKEKYL